MAITCLRNFEASGVQGKPGKTLSGEEIEIVGPLGMIQLHQEGLVMGEADASSNVEAPGSGGEVDDPAALDEAMQPEAESEAKPVQGSGKIKKRR